MISSFAWLVWNIELDVQWFHMVYNTHSSMFQCPCNLYLHHDLLSVAVTFMKPICSSFFSLLASSEIYILKILLNCSHAFGFCMCMSTSIHGWICRVSYWVNQVNEKSTTFQYVILSTSNIRNWQLVGRSVVNGNMTLHGGRSYWALKKCTQLRFQNIQ